ncbi:hypothetical protein D3C80_1839160 [compost metagenome]
MRVVTQNAHAARLAIQLEQLDQVAGLKLLVVCRNHALPHGLKTCWKVVLSVYRPLPWLAVCQPPVVTYRPWACMGGFQRKLVAPLWRTRNAKIGVR